MEVSFATGGAPSDVQATAQQLLTAAAGDDTYAKSLASSVGSYIGTQLAGVPKGQSAALRVHISIGVQSPAAEGAHANAGPTLEEIKAAATAAAVAAIAAGHPAS